MGIRSGGWRAWPRLRISIAVAVGSMLVVGLGLVAFGPRNEDQRCPPPTNHRDWSVARRWDEALLDAIRRSLPNPPVHARNLFHTSVAMWDAWAAYDPSASGYVFKEKVAAKPNVEAARNEAISYAAYRLLSERFSKAVGADASLAEFNETMEALCYPVADVSTAGGTPSSVGNRVAAAVIAYGLDDGSNEADGYTDPTYKPVNAPLVVNLPGTTMSDANHWQPLQLPEQVAQNGLPIPGTVQRAIGSHWGQVTPFALPLGPADGLAIDPGPPPRLGDPATDAIFKAQAVEVIRDSSLLDPTLDETINISPGARGANDLGTDDGGGHALNKVTGRAYDTELVRIGDFTRALTEFWADGPKSETPPGHWNVIANAAADALAPRLRIGGAGPIVDRLQWDVKLYFALNGAVHDAAIAAWGAKRHYDGTRPISMIRLMGGRGQSSDPNGMSYDPEGLPLVDGLIEVVTRDNSRPGKPLVGLAEHVGEVAIRAWRGNPADPKTGQGGVGWILAVNWVPYQLPTFVTPSFQGFVSGHSAFSRAAAEVMTSFTGTGWFPGGLFEWTVPAGSLKVEQGPSTDVVLQWATYYDAADQAGQSRLFGGIHVQADDFTGRVIGAKCGEDAWALAQQYYAGNVRLPD